MEKVYRTKVDLRVLGDEIKFVFFMSGNVNSRTPSEIINKRASFHFIYDTDYPVDVIVEIKNGVQRVFLYFDEKLLKFYNINKFIGLKRTPIILEVFRNSKGNFGFEKIQGGMAGAFLSHRNYFSTSPNSGSIKPFGKIIGGKAHALQMIIPGVNFRKNTIHNLSFDMDMFIENCGQYIHSLDFKVNLDENKIIKGDIISIEPVKQITTPPQEIKLETTYLTLHPKDLADRELIYDYKKQLTPQNCLPETLDLISSRVYAVENPLTPNVNLEDVNLPSNNLIEIPYNVSRFVENNEIKESRKVFKNGKYVFPLNWAQELQNNELFADADKCYSLKFATKTQLKAFSEKLKNQQIGSVETYPTINSQGQVQNIPRTYSRISQWVNRSSLNTFTDIRFTYTVDGDINTITICPSKECVVGPQKIGSEKGLYTSGNEYLLPNGKEYIGYYHVHPEKGAMVGANHTPEAHDILTPLYTIAPISANTITDFCFTTYDKKDEKELYTGFTATTGDANIPNKTYDLHLSGASFSANTIVPISNIERQTKMKLIGDTTLEYRPYVFSQAYGRNNGTLIFNETDTDNYLTYSAITSGVYRFTYKGYLNIKYTDSQWCEYLEKAYPSGFTGSYPSNDYEIKRLINTSIIQAGDGEKEVVATDTDFKFNAGEKYRDCKSGREKYICGDAPANTGILNFNFTASLIRGSSTGGTGTTLTQFKVVRSRQSDGYANAYLTLDVDKNDMTTSGANSCVLSSMTSSTIFHKQIPVTLDTGLINLISGQTIQLKYETDWNTTSKGGFYYLTGGATAIDINFGHRLDMSGNTLESPYYRGIKASNGVVSKKLFFDSTKKSLPFDYKVGDITRTVELDGSLYLSDSECGNIKIPFVSTNTFGNLNFVDSSAPDDKLVWDITTEKPSNNWQTMIENNTIKDYVLSDKSNSKMTGMKENGLFSFYIPTYNSHEYGGKCDFNFPQLSQSYVIVNNFKNYYGNTLLHYIVITPDCGFHKPCSGTKVASIYDIIHKTTPADWKVVNLNRKLNIKGKDVNIVSAFSHYNPEPETVSNSTKCKYYCQCGQELASSLNLDPIYGITNIFHDLETKECNDCLKNAQEYCFSLNNNCRAHLVGDCATDNLYIEQVINNLRPQILSTPATSTLYGGEEVSSGGGKPAGPGGPEPKKPTSVDGEGRGGIEPKGRPSGRPRNPDELEDNVNINIFTNPGGGIYYTGDEETQTIRYSCKDGLCFEDPNGRFTSFEECVKLCTQVITDEGGDGPVKPPKSDPEDEPGRDLSDDVYVEDSDKISDLESPSSKDSGLCKSGYYWCESVGRCISEKEPCKG